MNYEQEIRLIREQLEASTKVLDSLTRKLESSENKPLSIENTANINRIVSYLALSADIEDDDLLAMVLKSAMYVVDADGAGLTLLDSETNKLVFKAAIGDGAENIIGYSVPLQGSQHGLAFATGDVQSSTPINDDIEEIANAEFKNVLVAPLFIGEDKIGTISAVNKRSGDHFTPSDIEAYRHFAGVASSVVRQNQRESFLKEAVSGNGQQSTELFEFEFSEESRQLMSVIKKLNGVALESPSLLSTIDKIIDGLIHSPSNNLADL